MAIDYRKTRVKYSSINLNDLTGELSQATNISKEILSPGVKANTLSETNF